MRNAQASMNLLHPVIGLCALVSMLMIAVPPAEAQVRVVLAGAVADSRSGEAVSSVVVTLDGQVVAVTDSDGAFQIDSLVPGMTVLLRFERRGYEALSAELEVGIDQARIALNVTMEPGTVELAPVVVEGAVATRRTLTGFENRRAMGMGAFVTREEFEEWNPRETTDVLRHLPRIRVRPNRLYGVGGDRRRMVVETTRDVGNGPPEAGPECPALFFMDGVFLGSGQQQIIDEISIEDIDAIEVYGGLGQVPAQFNRAGARCGVVVMWSRVGEGAVGSSSSSAVYWGLTGAGLGLAIGLLSSDGCERCLVAGDRKIRSVGNVLILTAIGVVANRFIIGTRGKQERASRGDLDLSLGFIPQPYSWVAVGGRLRF